MEIQELLKREEILWHQKSRIKSLASFDLNTRFFYLSTMIRRRRNFIDFMKKENGEWISGWEEIGQCFQNFFNNLFSSSTLDIPYDLNNLIPRCITTEDNEMLLAMPSMEEIKTTVFSMDSHKAPRPDGMSPLFFKHYWHLIGGDIVDAILSFFQGDCMLREINHTFITLIPKHERAAMVNQFKPISLCNVLYKIISKLLTNRLRPLIHKMIFPWQAAFIQGRKIQDNSIIAHEIIQTMRKKKGKEKWMAIKLDMEKA